MFSASKSTVLLLLLLYLLLSGNLTANERLPRLVLSGPYATVSIPLIHLVETGGLSHLADEVVFRPWRNPDQLRASVVQGDAQVLALPTNVAANLYNRGADLQLLNVSTWGVLWMVSREPGLQTLADFRGKELVIPFREDMPDITFQLLAEQQGLNPRRDMKLRYVASPMDAMQLLITRRADHALLAEPAISMALRRTKSFPVSVIAPELYRSVDLQQEYGRLFERESRIPQAGLAVMGSVKNNPELARAIADAYALALQECQQQPDECASKVAGKMDLLTEEAISDALKISPMLAVSAHDAREPLEFFLNQMLQRSPGLVGGKLPDAGFYFQ